MRVRRTRATDLAGERHALRRCADMERVRGVVRLCAAILPAHTGAHFLADPLARTDGRSTARKAEARKQVLYLAVTTGDVPRKTVALAMNMEWHQSARAMAEIEDARDDARFDRAIERAGRMAGALLRSRHAVSAARYDLLAACWRALNAAQAEAVASTDREALYDAIAVLHGYGWPLRQIFLVAGVPWGRSQRLTIKARRGCFPGSSAKKQALSTDQRRAG